MLFGNHKLIGAIMLGGSLLLGACGSDNSVQAISAEDLQTLTTPEDTPLVVTISGGNAAGLAMTVKVLEPPAHGTFDVVQGSEPLTVTYTPGANFSGVDEFFYQITTGDERSEIQALGRITVTPAADPPLFQVTAEGDEDTQIPLTVSVNLVDGDGSETLSAVVISGLPEGVFLTNGSSVGSGVYSLSRTQLPGLKFVLPADLDQNFFITLEANTTEVETGETALTTVEDFEVTVNPVPDAPDPQDVTAAADEDGFVDIVLDATDVDTGDTVSLTGFSGLANASVTDTSDNPLVFPILLPTTVRVTLDPDQDLDLDFGFVTTDTFSESSTGLVHIDVTPFDDVPEAILPVPAPVVAEDSSVTFLLSATDPDTGDVLSLTGLPVLPAHGTLTTLGGADLLASLPLVLPLAVRYTPAHDADTSVTFDFTVSDSDLNSDTDTVAVTVQPVAENPRAVGVTSYVLNENAFVDFTLDGTDPDTVDDGTCNTFGGSGGDIRVLSIGGGQPSNGALTDQSDGALSFPSGTITKGVGNGLAVRYRPNASWFGNDAVTYTVQDRCNRTHSQTIAFTVNRVPVAPSAPTLNAATDEDTFALVSIPLSTNPADAATHVVDRDVLYGDTVRIAAVNTVPSNGSLQNISGGALTFPLTLPATVRYVPNGDFNGGDSFVLDVADTEPGTTVQLTVNVTVNPANDAPVFYNVPQTVNCASGNAISFQAQGGDDIDGSDPVTFARNGGTCAWGTVAADGTLGGTCPVQGIACTIGVAISDGGIETRTDYVTVQFNTRFVATNTSGAANGTSWANVTNNLQQAIDDLYDAGVFGGEVWVRRGTYRSTDAYPLVSLQPGVEIYGGFVGTENNKNSRPTSPFVHSVFSGDTDSSGTLTDGDAESVVYSYLDYEYAVLDGIEITGGNAIGYDWSSDGGGIYAESSYLTLNNCRVRGNHATDSGGGIYAYDGEIYTSGGTLFDSNQSYQGAAIFADSNSLYLDRTRFENGYAMEGGAIYASFSFLDIEDVIFIDNVSGAYGGAIVANPALGYVTNSTFRNNTTGTSAAGYGGAILLNDLNSFGWWLDVINSSFADNTAIAGDGGAIMYFNSNGSAVNNAFWGNDDTFIDDEIGLSSSSPYIDYNCTQNGWFGGNNVTLGADPFDYAASGELFLAAASPCRDIGDDGLADSYFNTDWRTLTVDLSLNTLDSSPVDAGHHRPTNRVWISTFFDASPTVLQWTTHSAASCRITGGSLPAAGVAVSTAGTYSPGASGDYTLTCQGLQGPSVATATLP